jgi:sigma-B regulation protein RsbU (phosphoserine phosphatase)
VTEALDSAGDEFGVERMIESIQASAGHNNSAQAIITRVIDDVRNFAGTAPQHDDITLIAVRKT